MQQQHIPVAQPVPGQMHMGAGAPQQVEYEQPAWAGLCW